MQFAFDDQPDESDELDLDRDFPLGDGTADTSGIVTCPYCGEANPVSLDPGSGDRQEYVEDCPVCCQPWRVIVRYGHDGHAAVRVHPLDQ